jgi:hypothetical protein
MKKGLLVFLMAATILTPILANACQINGNIGGNSSVSETCEESWAVRGSIVEGSTVNLTSNQASIRIDGSIKGESKVELNAPKASISVGGGISDESSVKLTTGEGMSISVSGSISGGAKVCLIAGGGVNIGGVVEGDGTEVYWQGTSIRVRFGNTGTPLVKKDVCPF